MDEHAVPALPPRDPEGHKGTFGTVCVLGGQAAGSRVIIGGPAFSATAALRVGAGLAVLAVPRPIMTAALVIAPSATGLALPVDDARALKPSEVASLLDEQLASYRCVAVGPGWGADFPQQQILIRLLAQGETPMVIDADGLNALAQIPEFAKDLRGPTILTPHPGEFSRLARALGLDDHDPTNAAAREDAAQTLARRLGCVVVLKGANTVISDGIEVAVNQTGNAALATAGTGDVLTGMIAGLVAQHFRESLGGGSRQITPEQRGGLSLYACARIAVHVHGLAADLWAAEHGEEGLTAATLLDLIPPALTAFRRNQANA